MPFSFDGIDDNLSSTIDGATGVDTDLTTHAFFVRVFTQPVSQKSCIITSDSLDPGTKIRRAGITNPVSSGFQPFLRHGFSVNPGGWSTNNDFNINVWHSIVITYDGSSITPDATFYVDNGSADSQEDLATPNGTRDTGFDSFRCGLSEGGVGGFNGALAFVCLDAGTLWNAAQRNRFWWYGHPGGLIELAYPLITTDITNKGTITTANLTAHNGAAVAAEIMNATKGFVLLRSCT